MKRAPKFVIVLVGASALPGCKPGDPGWDSLQTLRSNEDREHERQVFRAWRADYSQPRAEGVPFVMK